MRNGTDPFTGILIGRSGLGLIETDDLIKTLMFLGLNCLMFLTGMEIDLGALWSSARTLSGERRPRPLLAETAIFALSFGAMAAWAWGLHLLGLVLEPLFLFAL